MHLRFLSHPGIALSLAAVLIMIALSPSSPPVAEIPREEPRPPPQQEAPPMAAMLLPHGRQQLTSSPELLRVMGRLQKRIESRFGFTLSRPDTLSGLREQRTLLRKHLTVTFTTDDGTEVAPVNASPEQHPLWLQIEVTPGGMHSRISKAKVFEELSVQIPTGIRLPAHATLLSLSTVDHVRKAETDAIAKPGYDYDAERVAEQVMDALASEVMTLEIPLRTVTGRIENGTGEDLGALELLATGRSNFAGSGVGRKSNVRKGLAQHLHNTVVPAGQSFGINSVFENVPMASWELALGIFDGWELRPVAGGGICQVATTLYRAILTAGFPVLKRASHSLFVHYYEKYGVGLDATIFPGKQDLVFLNDTAGSLLIQAYTEGDEATVSIYGTPDGREASLEGPYFSETAPADLEVNGRPLSKREIAWRQRIAFPDGREESHWIISHYNSIPVSVTQKYLHAAAP